MVNRALSKPSILFTIAKGLCELHRTWEQARACYACALDFLSKRLFFEWKQIQFLTDNFQWLLYSCEAINFSLKAVSLFSQFYFAFKFSPQAKFKLGLRLLFRLSINYVVVNLFIKHVMISPYVKQKSHTSAFNPWKLYNGWIFPHRFARLKL